MEAKEFFQQIRNIDKQIGTKLEQLCQLETLATKVNSTMSEVPTFGTGNGRKMEDTIAKIIDLQSEVDIDVDTLVDLKRKAMMIICQIRNDKARLVMEERYLSGKTFEQISVDLDCSWQWVHKLHKKGLRAAEEIMKNISDS